MSCRCDEHLLQAGDNPDRNRSSTSEKSGIWQGGPTGRAGLVGIGKFAACATAYCTGHHHHQKEKELLLPQGGILTCCWLWSEDSSVKRHVEVYAGRRTLFGGRASRESSRTKRLAVAQILRRPSP